MRCVQIAVSDTRMDCRDMIGSPVNVLPTKCRVCGFPDLDHVPQPYSLIKSRTRTQNELAGAENGNFLIRERARRVLELAAPGLCSYFPTCYKGTTQETPWLLAVPNIQVVSGAINHSALRCVRRTAVGAPRIAVE